MNNKKNAAKSTASRKTEANTWYLYGTLYPGASEPFWVFDNEEEAREHWDFREEDWKSPDGELLIENSNWGHGLYKVTCEGDPEKMNQTDLRYFVWFSVKEDSRLQEAIYWDDWGEQGLYDLDYYHFNPDDEDDDTVYWTHLPEGFSAEILEMYREPYKMMTEEEIIADAEEWERAYEAGEVLDVTIGDGTEEEYDAEVQREIRMMKATGAL